MRKLIGSNQHKDKYRFITRYAEDKIMLVIMAAIILAGIVYLLQPKIISPCPIDGCYVKVIMAKEPITREQQIDKLVDVNCNKFYSKRYDINRCKALTHYLLLREQNYGGSNNCGDSGLACGPMQFHTGTYTKNRKDMIKKGLTKKLGSRENMENAIETAIYMFSIGQEKQCGPVLREEIKL